jgi:periplasmic protein TonB
MTVAAQSLPEPPRLARRRADRADGKLPRDRLATTLVLMALLYGLIILGVSFTAPGSKDSSIDRGLEVLLVSDELPEALRNDTAQYISQRTQTGSGNTQERLPAQLPSQKRPATGAEATAAQSAESLEDQLLSSSNERSPTQVLAMPLPATEAMAAEIPSPAERAGDDALRLRGARRDELYVTADTRASRLAPYLDGWRQRVERVGTVNYPSAAQRRGLSGNPVVEVAIARDGSLLSARVQKSSGRPEIDAAAIDILRLASPFDPFPPELARDYRSLRFAYEWQFRGGQVTESAISVP